MAQTSARHVTLATAILEAQDYWNVSCGVVGSSVFSGIFNESVKLFTVNGCPLLEPLPY